MSYTYCFNIHQYSPLITKDSLPKLFTQITTASFLLPLKDQFFQLITSIPLSNELNISLDIS